MVDSARVDCCADACGDSRLDDGYVTGRATAHRGYVPFQVRCVLFQVCDVPFQVRYVPFQVCCVPFFQVYVVGIIFYLGTVAA